MERREMSPNPIAKRLQLHLWMGQIMADPELYYSEAFGRCVDEISKVNQEIAERKIDTTALLNAMQVLTTPEPVRPEANPLHLQAQQQADVLPFPGHDLPPDVPMAA